MNKSISRRGLLKGFAAAGAIAASPLGIAHLHAGIRMNGHESVGSGVLADVSARWLFRDDGAMNLAARQLKNEFHFGARLNDFFHSSMVKRSIDLQELRNGISAEQAQCHFADWLDLSAKAGERELEGIVAEASADGSRIITPSADTTKLVLYFRRASSNKALEGAKVTIEGTDFDGKVKMKTDKKGRIILQNLTPGAVYKILAKRKAGKSGWFGYETYVTLSSGDRSYDLLWLVDTYWQTEAGKSKKKFPADFFKETTFGPKLNRLEHPGDAPEATLKQLRNGTREMTVYIDPAFDSYARQTIRDVIQNEWVILTDNRIKPVFEFKKIGADDADAEDSLRIVFNNKLITGSHDEKVSKDGFLTQCISEIGGSAKWSILEDFVVDLRKGIVREQTGQNTGPRNLDNFPFEGITSFLTASGDNSYSYFDRNVLPKVLYRLKVDTSLLATRFETDKPK